MSLQILYGKQIWHLFLSFLSKFSLRLQITFWSQSYQQQFSNLFIVIIVSELGVHLILSTTLPSLSLASVAEAPLGSSQNALPISLQCLPKFQISKLFQHHTTDLPTLIYLHVFYQYPQPWSVHNLYCISIGMQYRHFYSSQLLIIFTKPGKLWCGSTKITNSYAISI